MSPRKRDAPPPGASPAPTEPSTCMCPTSCTDRWADIAASLLPLGPPPALLSRAPLRVFPPLLQQEMPGTALMQESHPLLPTPWPQNDFYQLLSRLGMPWKQGLKVCLKCLVITYGRFLMHMCCINSFTRTCKSIKHWHQYIYMYVTYMCLIVPCSAQGRHIYAHTGQECSLRSICSGCGYMGVFLWKFIELYLIICVLFSMYIIIPFWKLY